MDEISDSVQNFRVLTRFYSSCDIVGMDDIFNVVVVRRRHLRDNSGHRRWRPFAAPIAASEVTTE